MFQKELQERFVRYCKIFTTSDITKAKDQKPSTENQWDLIHLLEKELKDMGVPQVELHEKGYLFARLPANHSQSKTSIGFMAHVDTSSDAPGENVDPQIHENYQGEDIQLKDNVSILAKDNPDLALYIGESVITSDGTTLLGADDKAGVAEIMTVINHLLKNPEIPHGPLEFVLTPDEETGYGMTGFPLEELQSPYCYTMDAGGEGEIESECYYAWKAEVEFHGQVIHPGQARGKLVNSLTMAGNFISMLPRNESPEATDGRFGNYWPHDIRGTVDSSYLTVYARDFDRQGMERRLEALDSFARAIEAGFPGGKVVVKKEKQYLNMREGIEGEPRLMGFLQEALKELKIPARMKPIRGGTDGSRLTEMGVPTPNVFTGGHNFHSVREWIGLPTMEKACKVMLSVIEQWAKEE